MDLPIDDVPLGLDIKKQRIQKNTEKRTTRKSLQARRYRKEHKVKLSVAGEAVKSSTVPSPVEEFSKLIEKPHNFLPMLLDNLRKLEYNVPTPVQAQTIPIMLQHRNLLACAPTGSGKTAAYLLPILNEYMRFVDSVPDWSGISASDTKVPNEIPHKILIFGLILAPTQELVRQIWSEAMRLALGLSNKHFVACLKRKHYADRGKNKSSKISSSPNEDKEMSVPKNPRRIREFRLPCSTRILIATPCRIGTLLSLDSSQCPFDLSRLSWLIIDECDKMLQVNLAHSDANANRKSRRPRSFRDQMDPIFQALGKRSSHESTQSVNPKVALFSATIPEEVSQWAREELSQLVSNTSVGGIENGDKLIELFVGKRSVTENRHPDHGVSTSSYLSFFLSPPLSPEYSDSAVSTVSQELRYCATEEGKLLEVRCLLLRGLTYPCLIFMESRERAKELVKEILLSDTEILAGVISSDKTEAQRAAVIRAFREGHLNVLVCTDLLGRGIDFKGVSMVVNYDLPPTKEDYIHRVGRTGRAGHRGKAITLWTDADLPYLGEILKVIRRSGSKVDPELERLVNDWQKRRAHILLGKRNSADAASASVSPNLIVSRRRGERRLVKEILHKSQEEAKTHEVDEKKSGKPLKWLRRWNPYRKPIHELAGARATRPTMLEDDNVNRIKTKKRRKFH
ncbi:putative ATP-dependent RNA helicase DDX52 [Fasciola gigantica]|uniref:ATP-dependent RNA helicase n=1 Tax=Fasciola gigantica TaxID=46835 RepID=A0A504YF54_FASGI|nr:putative ATP-dependent RNA helicase DDX52 [Fasciola gigantica]